MISIAHIVNPFNAKPGSDLVIAQPISFETMKIARDFARGHVEVAHYAAFFTGDEAIVPTDFHKTKPLERSIRDVHPAPSPGLRKLPLIKDILDRLYAESQADVLIYTNVDIALMPHFYVTVAQLIEQGREGFIINRRTINQQFKLIEELPLMFSAVGERHPGSDCFVFRRTLYPSFKLGNIAIGCYFFGLTLRSNVAGYCGNFEHFRDMHVTFHIGDDRVWQEMTAEALHNNNELEIIFPILLADRDIKNKEPVTELHRQFLTRSKELKGKSQPAQPTTTQPEDSQPSPAAKPPKPSLHVFSNAARKLLPQPLYRMVKGIILPSQSNPPIFPTGSTSPNRSVMFISLHKCASTFFAGYLLHRLLGLNKVDYQLLHYMDLIDHNGRVSNPYDTQQLFRLTGKAVLPLLLDPVLKTPAFGYVYGVLRILEREHPTYDLTELLLSKEHLANKKLIFLVRDPRDILVSMYYSFGFTHPFSPNPAIKEYQERRRERIQGQTINEYTLAEAPKLKEKFDKIHQLLENGGKRDILFLKYEDLIDHFEQFYRDFDDFVKIKAGIRDEIFQRTRPKEKEQMEHRRKGTPGDFKSRLSRETITELNRILAEILHDSGYRV